MTMHRTLLVFAMAAVVALATAAVASATTYSTSSSFGFVQHPDAALGQINFNTGPGACRQGRKVKLFRKRHGRDALVGSDRSDSAGQWEVNENLRDGKRYYVKILSKTFGYGNSCRSYTSSALRFPSGTA